MRILVGTDILLLYLQKQEMEGISLTLRWIERLKAQKFTDMSSIAILTNFVSMDSFRELSGFEVLEGVKNKASIIAELERRDKYRELRKYRPLLAQLNWLCYRDVDLMITENAMSQRLAKMLGVDDKVYSMENFIEKCSAEHRDLDETRGVFIRKVKFGELDYNDRFFNSFKAEYEPYYHSWFRRKAGDDVYVAKDEKENVRGLLKLKIEEKGEDFGDVSPRFTPARRLKICSFKTDFTSQKIGQRFMRIVFETALQESVDEIYVTLFANSTQRRRLVGMIKQWGFYYYGTKDEEEQVFVRQFRKVLSHNTKFSYPFCSSKNGCLLVLINSYYAEQLLPPPCNDDMTDVEPVKQAIKKVLILRHLNDNTIASGVPLLFCQKTEDAGMCRIISLGILENVYHDFRNESEFISRCRKRSGFTNSILHDFWIGASGNPVVVEFLYVYHFEQSITRIELDNLNIDISKIQDSSPIKIGSREISSFIKNTPYEKIVITDTSQIC